jgi:rhodanese-related sulfurtransferase
LNLNEYADNTEAWLKEVVQKIGSEDLLEPKKTVYIKIKQDEAKRMMDEEEVIILDVRTETEFSKGHIKNAVSLPVDNVNRDANSILPNKDAKILVYCRSGNRSKVGSMELIKLGYSNVYDFGGISKWKYKLEK